MRNEIEIKQFSNGGRLNADDADFSLQPNDWVNAENVRIGSTDKGVVNTFESIGGTLLKSVAQPSVTFIGLGSVSDEENGLFVKFKYDIYSNNHKITCFIEEHNFEYDLILNAHTNYTLGFNKNFPIHSAGIADGRLYWCDGENQQPKEIDIFAALKANYPATDFDSDADAYVFPLLFKQTTLIKPPAIYAPNILKSYDGAFANNFIANDSFQVAFEYVYSTNEQSVIGCYSPASKLNSDGQTSNFIQVTMDGSEFIPNTVKLINLIVRYGNSNIANCIKTWDRSIASELAEITAHNNLTQQLTYAFYNNLSGEGVPKDRVLKPFDSVPVYSEAMAFAKNRLCLGNNVEGYDTPTTTSLSSSLTTSNIFASASITRPLVQFRARISGSVNYAAFFVYLDGTSGVTAGYYYLNGTALSVVVPSTFLWTVFPTLAAPVSSTSMAGLTFYGATQETAFAAILATYPPATTFINKAVFPSSYTLTITGLSSSFYSVFKTRSPYRYGIVFYDFAMRKCGVVTDDGCIFSIPTRNYSFTSAVTAVTWNLSNASALSEIPEWAYYYSVVRTLNQKTRFFIEGFDKAAKYATKDTTGKWVFTNTTYSTNVNGIGLSTTALIKAGLGYVFNEGDVCVLIDNSNNVYEIPVIGQDGTYIILKAQDVGILTNKKFVFEIYSPYKTSEAEPFFEVGEVYNITNPGTAIRTFGTTSGVFLPDAFVISRNFDTDTYLAEAMCPNDLFYKRWDNDGGKPNFITKLGQVRKLNSISFSNTFIQNTALNGLSTFDALDEATVPEDCGAIQKLLLTSKVQGEGTVMMAICTNEAASVYLGETQITDSTGATQFFTSSEGFISTINVLKGGFGTLNPESVCFYRGNVYWWDRINGRIIQYASNGLFPISNYKMTRFWKLFSDQFNSMTTTQIEALGCRPFVFMTVDPYHDELLISIPKLLAAPPKGYLPDYPSTVYPFDIYDGQAKTMIYDLKEEPNRWLGSYSFYSEGFITLNNKLYSDKAGQIYLHNQTTNYNQFYGVQYKSKIMFVSNMLPNIPKVYNAVKADTNMRPTLTYFYNDYPYQQASDLMDFDYRDLEGRFCATLYRNKLVPTAIGMNTDGLLTGEKMRATAMKVMLEFTVGTTPLELKYVEIGFVPSRGQT